MRKITAAQNRLIHVLAARQGMDDELLHTHVWNVTKKDHISSLDSTEAGMVINGLKGRLEYEKGNHMTNRQKSFIFCLMKQCGWVDDNGNPDTSRLDGFIKSQYGIGSHHWIDVTIASNLIEFFKDLKKRPGKEKEDQGQA